MCNTLIMTVGLPQSGKTTWAQTQRHPIVNPDSIRLALHGQPFYGDAEPFVWSIAKCMVRSLFLAGHETVILDATNITRKRRDDWISKDWLREFIVIGSPDGVDTYLKRAERTCRDEEHLESLKAVIRRMAEAWEPVSDEERRL